MPPLSRVADILMEQGRQAAAARERSGQIWGGMVQRLGELPGEAIQAHQRQQQQAQENAARKARLDLDTTHLAMLRGDRDVQAAERAKKQQGEALTGNLLQQHRTFNDASGHWEYDHGAVMDGLIAGGHPEAASHYLELGGRIEDFVAETEKKHRDLEAHKRQGYADIFGAVANAPEAERDARYGIMLKALPPTATNDPVLGKLPPVYPGHEAFTGMYENMQTDAQRWERQAKKTEARLKGTHEVPPGGKLVQIDADTGDVKTLAEGGLPAGAADKERHELATEGRAIAADKETIRHHRALEGHAAATERRLAAGGGTATGTDAKAIADSIVRGESPPDTKGLFRFAGPVRAELARQGYDLTHANLDWQATQKHLSTLNNSQQTRLRQSINTAAESLDVIDELAKKWDAGRFPLLNKANLTLAKGGAFGKEAASVATQLEGQITDVTSELGNVYMGGNSPTDHALQLAGKNLSANWDKKVLLDMTGLARKNLRIRNNSMLNVGVAGAREGNLYAAPVPTEAAIPTNVAKALKGASAGRHTLSDGSVWTVGTDGKVTK